MRSSIIDIVKGISIIMIVNVHLLSGQFFLIGCTYHVIAFFFTAGIVQGMRKKWEDNTISSFTKDKLTRLGYPFLTLSVCYMLMHMILNCIRGETIVNEVITGSIIKTLTLQGIGTLWFLPVLFFGELIFYSVKRKKINDHLILLTGFLAVLTSSYLNNRGFELLQISCKSQCLFSFIKILATILLSSLIASTIIYLGFHVHQRLPNLFSEDVIRTKKEWIYMILICIFSFVIDYYFIEFYHGDLHKLDIGDPFVYIICSLTGIAFVFSFSFIIKKLSKNISKLLIYFGENSLIIMTTHTEYYINSIAYVFISYCLAFWNISAVPKNISALSIILIMIIEIGVIYIIKHTCLKYIYVPAPKR